jgi:hypothetical protein
VAAAGVGRARRQGVVGRVLADLAEALQDDQLLERFDDPGYVALLERLTSSTP